VPRGAISHSPHFSFNPTLVRLQRNRSSWRSGAPTGFNPILVRLQPKIAANAAAAVISFNPTLVQLQPEGGSVQVASHRRPLPVSIPHWSDFNRTRTGRSGPSSRPCAATGGVSIPHWSDFNGTAPAGDPVPQLVSIPYWFGFNPKSPLMPRRL